MSYTDELHGDQNASSVDSNGLSRDPLLVLFLAASSGISMRLPLPNPGTNSGDLFEADGGRCGKR